jgi:hypothetical protein
MILTGIDGQGIYLAPSAIAQVIEAGASSQWHGIKAIVRTFDGRVLEVREEFKDIMKELS